MSSTTALAQVGLDIGDIAETVSDLVQPDPEPASEPDPVEQPAPVADTPAASTPEAVPEMVTEPVASPPAVNNPAVVVTPGVIATPVVKPVAPPEPVVAAAPANAIMPVPANALALSQNDAIQAVMSSRALPLERIMQKASAHTSGNVVNAQLISVRGRLLYQIRVIEDDGDVDELYFYAQSGVLVRKN